MQWCKQNGVTIHRQNCENKVRFEDVERVVLDMLPAHFPYLHANTNFKYSESLMVVRKNFFHADRVTYVCAVEPVVIQHVNDRLGSRSAHGVVSLFDKFGYTEEDGSPVRVSTKQFRHFLNTLAQSGGLSQLDIAKWSGRKDIRQNEAYDHVSADEMLGKLREALQGDQQAIAATGKMAVYKPIPRDEFSRLVIPTAHVTIFGYCVHDYSMTPCEAHRDCVNCHEHTCVKGNKEKEVRLRDALNQSEQLLEKAKEAQKSGYAGHDRWMEHHKVTVERLRQLCGIMADPNVPVGSVIQLSNVRTASRIEQAVLTRAALPAPVDAANVDPPVELLEAFRSFGGEN